MNDLYKFTLETNHRFSDKHLHFYPVYDNYLSQYRGKEVTLVEIGIKHGGSLQNWKNYLGPNAKIYGVDIAEHTAFEEPQIECIIGDQSNKYFLKELRGQVGPIDIFIDDGSHYPKDQILTFEEMWSSIKPGGLYFCEDTHTSYRELYEGGYKKPGTMIEYCKDLVDGFYYAEDGKIKRRDDTIDFIAFYFCMVVIKKKGTNGIN